MPRAYIAVGSNIAPQENIREALRRLAQSTHLVSISTFYRTPPIDRPKDGDYYNGVVAINADMSAMELKWKALRGIEAEFGRHRNADKYAARPIDLDLLLYGDCVLSSTELTLPAPDILTRAFIAVPLYEIAPALVLPGSRLQIRHVAEGLSTESMQPLEEYTCQLRRGLLG